MKLIVKITLLFLLIASFIFLIGATFTYNAMSREIEKEERLFLQERLQSVLKYLSWRKPDGRLFRDKMVITPLDYLAEETEPVFSDTLVKHITLQRIEPHLKMDIIKHVDGQAYKIVIYDLIIEEDDIEDAIRESMIKTYLLLLGVCLVLSFIASYIVFKPFQGTLFAIRDFSLKDTEEIRLPESSTSEFNKLNKFIYGMTQKVRKDYQSLKEFSENASHEIQTPISIAQGKLELLMESANLDEEQMELINAAQNALSRLSKMGTSLALLTKIENREFSDFSSIDFSRMINGLLFEFRELVELKSITLNSSVAPHVQVKGNEVLLEILVTNLINNAIRHNKPSGTIDVVLEPDRLLVTNTGEELDGNPEELFRRFKKGSKNPDSSGLGLSIVRKICEEHNFSVEYRAKGEQHSLTVSW